MNGYAGIFGDPIFSNPPIPSLKGVSGYVTERRRGVGSLGALGAVDFADPLLCGAFQDSRGTGNTKPPLSIALLERNTNEAFRRNAGKYEGVWEIGGTGLSLRLYDRDPHPKGFVVGPQLDRQGKILGSVILQKDPRSNILRGRRRMNYYEKATSDLKAADQHCSSRAGSGYPYYNDIMVMRFPNDPNPQTAVATLLRVNGKTCSNTPAKFCSVGTLTNTWTALPTKNTHFDWSLKREWGSFRQVGATAEEIITGVIGAGEKESPAASQYRQQRQRVTVGAEAPSAGAGERPITTGTLTSALTEEEPEKPKWLMWAGVGGLGLIAAVLLLRR